MSEASILLLTALPLVVLLAFLRLREYPTGPPTTSLRRRSKKSRTPVDKTIKRDKNGRDFIYAWRDPDQKQYVKIGRANNWVQRMNAFQTAVAKPIEVVMVIDVKDDVATEKYIHRLWSHYHVRAGGGSEWFRAEPDLMKWLRKMSDPIGDWNNGKVAGNGNISRAGNPRKNKGKAAKSNRKRRNNRDLRYSGWLGLR